MLKVEEILVSVVEEIALDGVEIAIGGSGKVTYLVAAYVVFEDLRRETDLISCRYRVIRRMESPPYF